jgi:hypothetical protein
VTQFPTLRQHGHRTSSGRGSAPPGGCCGTTPRRRGASFVTAATAGAVETNPDHTAIFHTTGAQVDAATHGTKRSIIIIIIIALGIATHFVTPVSGGVNVHVARDWDRQLGFGKRDAVGNALRFGHGHGQGTNLVGLGTELDRVATLPRPFLCHVIEATRKWRSKGRDDGLVRNAMVDSQKHRGTSESVHGHAIPIVVARPRSTLLLAATAAASSAKTTYRETFLIVKIGGTETIRLGCVVFRHAPDRAGHPGVAQEFKRKEIGRVDPAQFSLTDGGRRFRRRAAHGQQHEQGGKEGKRTKQRRLHGDDDLVSNVWAS